MSLLRLVLTGARVINLVINRFAAVRKMTGKHVLCVLLLFITLSWAEDAKRDVRKSDNNTGNAVLFYYYYFLI